MLHMIGAASMRISLKRGARLPIRPLDMRLRGAYRPRPAEAAFAIHETNALVSRRPCRHEKGDPQAALELVPGPQAGSRNDQRALRRRVSPTRPSTPASISVRLAGSGTAVTVRSNCGIPL
jgi:hypothetical protein